MNEELLYREDESPIQEPTTIDRSVVSSKLARKTIARQQEILNLK